MSSDIQFGELEHAEPERGIRPDRDAHFCVMPVGDIGMPDAEDAEQQDLLIFVDLDVMRDMEAHADSDTSVELGGVMLGRQLIDEQGRPFVVITDCLRAEHYHATKGSFKFTHDTWSQITERRKRHRPDLEMVGWYHTHPGWTVFLSGMDLFICNNFFNKPLDVALVIDPVNDDRGWFQWTDQPRPVTRPTKGFYLMANKYRQSELKYFSRLYSKGPAMNDPRYSDSSFGTSNPVVNIMDNRRPLIDFAIVSMLTLQFLLLGLLAWKMLMPAETPIATENPQPTLSSVDEAREQAYRDILRTVVSENGDDPALVDKYTAVKSENARMLANLDGQLVRAEKFAAERDVANMGLQEKANALNEMQEKMNLTQLKNEELIGKLEAFEKSGQESGGDAESSIWESSKFWWWSIVGGMLVIGGAVGYLFGHRKGKVDAYVELDEYDSIPSAPSDNTGYEPDDDPERIKLSLTDEQQEH